MTDRKDRRTEVLNKDVAAFLALAYLISWLFLGLFVVLWHTSLNQTLSWWVVVFLPGAYGPTIAAVIQVGRLRGWAGIRQLLGKLLRWRVRARWYAFALIVPPAVVGASILLSTFRSEALTGFHPWPGLLIAPVALVAALPFGPLGEELGWRGYALPRLLESAGLWRSSLILGLAWTFWHLPMFWFPGAAIPSFLSPGPASIGLYAAQITAEACLLTFLYVMTQGSVLLAVLYHLSFNTAETILFRMIPEPTASQELQVYVINIVLSWVLAAALLVWLGRRLKSTA